MPSLARNSLARIAADGSGLVLGTLFSIVTARWLGPSGKGLLSAVTFLAGFIMQASLLGLGDAVIVAVGQKRYTFQEAVSASTAMLFPDAVIAVAAMWAVSLLEFRGQWVEARTPVLAACLLILLNLVNQLYGNILNAQEEFVFTSTMLVAASSTMLILVWVFVVILHWGVVGAVLATAGGIALSAMATISFLLFHGTTVRPAINLGFARFALKFGAKVQASNILVTAAARFDLLLVYALAGQAAAGQYSVALTVGALSMMLPYALTLTSFPRLASLSEGEARQLAMRVNRVVLMAAVVVTLVLSLVSPILIPLAFGRLFRPAVVPTIILLIGGIFSSSQYVLARSRAARGDAGLLFWSYFVNTAVMLLLDILLIPRFQTVGAAVASTVGNLVGLTVSLAGTARAAGGRFDPTELIPGKADIRELLSLPARMFSSPEASKTVRNVD